MSARDPRIDPMPGDVLDLSIKEWRTIRVQIDKANDELVGYHPLGKYPNWAECSMMEWRKWAATAEVLKRGDEK